MAFGPIPPAIAGCRRERMPERAGKPGLASLPGAARRLVAIFYAEARLDWIAKRVSCNPSRKSSLPVFGRRHRDRIVTRS